MELVKGPIARFLFLALMAYAVLAITTNARDLLVVGNSLMIFVAVAVMIAYAKPAWKALVARPVTAVSLLAMGIFLSWAGSAVFRMISLMVYGLGRPDYAGTDFSTFALYLNFLAGLLHLAAPELSAEGLLPPSSWITAGIIAGGAVAVLIAIVLLRASH